MVAAGVNVAGSRLYTVAQCCLRAVGVNFDHAAQTFREKVKADPALIVALIGDAALTAAANEYLRRVGADMKSGSNVGAGHCSDDTHEHFARETPGSNVGAGQCKIDTHTRNARDTSGAVMSLDELQTLIDRKTSPNDSGGRGQSGSDTHGTGAPPPLSPSQRAARLAVVVEAKARVLDTLKIRDGRPIGDVRWHEIEKLITANTREAGYLKAIKNRFANVPDGFTRVRDLLSDDMMQKLKDEVDAHVKG